MTIDYQAADNFGVPERFFGALGDDFYSAVGRIANLSALLENHLLDLYQALTNSQQDEHSNAPATELCTGACTEVARLLEDGSLTVEAAETLREFVDEAKQCFRERNDYVHNLWSASGDGTIYGWRPGRHGRVTDEAREKGIDDVGTDQWYTEDASKITVHEARATVTSLVQLSQRWPGIYSLVSGRHHVPRTYK